MERFTSKFIEDPETGCWVWQASLGAGGYGRFRLNGKLETAHRVAWEMFKGPIPDGGILDHFVCDNPPCVNPEHLKCGSYWDNTRRGNSPVAINARKTHCPNGHALEDGNVYCRPGRNERECLKCRRNYRRNYYLQNSA